MKISSEASATSNIRHFKVLGISSGLAVVCSLAVWFIPFPVGADARHALAIGLFVLFLWITNILPHAVSGLVGCYLFWCIVGVPFSTAFGGFAQTNSWFVLAAGVFGLMTTKTRLAYRLAARVIGHSHLSYSRLVLGIILTNLLLNFFVPSGIARIIILAGIALGIVKSKGWDQDSLPAKGLFIALTVSCTLFDKLMITGGSTIVAQSIIEKVGQTRIYWSHWLLAQIPSLLLSVPACWALILWLFPYHEAPRQPRAMEDRSVGRAWSEAERRCAILLAATLCLWVTDFLHHIHAAMIALGAALLAVLPKIGVLKAEELKEIDFLPFIFTASALSLGDGLLKTGALEVITHAFTAIWHPWAHSFVPLAIAMYWTSFAYHLLVPSDPTTLATSLPAVMSYARGHNWSTAAVGLTWTLALTGKLFVYQSGVSIIGFSFGYFKAQDFLKAGICLAFVEFLIFLLLVIWYWPFIGLIR